MRSSGRKKFVVKPVNVGTVSTAQSIIGGVALQGRLFRWVGRRRSNLYPRAYIRGKKDF